MVSQQQYCLRWKYHHTNLQTMFSQLLDRGCFCDVTLACEGQTIRAHRVVLCACSTYFDQLLTNCSSEKDPIIIMREARYEDVKCLIEFMYRGEINVKQTMIGSLLKTAEELCIKGLAEVSWREQEAAVAVAAASPANTTTTANTSSNRVKFDCSSTVSSDDQHHHHSGSGSSSGAPHQHHYHLSPPSTMTTPPQTTTISVLTDSPDDSSVAVHSVNHNQNNNNVSSSSIANANGGAYELEEVATPFPGTGISSSRLLTVKDTSELRAVASDDDHERQEQQQQQQQHAVGCDAEQPEALPPLPLLSRGGGLPVGKKKRGRPPLDEEYMTFQPRPRLSQPVGLSFSPLAETVVAMAPEGLVPPIVGASEPTVKLTRDPFESADASAAAADGSAGPVFTKSERPDTPASSSDLGGGTGFTHYTWGSSGSVSGDSGGGGLFGQQEQDHLATGVAAKFESARPLDDSNNHQQQQQQLDLHHHQQQQEQQESTPPEPPTSPSYGVFLTPTEQARWRNVVKMNDYLKKGRRQQFWEEPFTKRVMEDIKQKALEMKKAAKILGVSYGTLYGHYRDTYGCLKHPYKDAPYTSRLRLRDVSGEPGDATATIAQLVDMVQREVISLPRAAELLNTTPATMSSYIERYDRTRMSSAGLNGGFLVQRPNSFGDDEPDEASHRAALMLSLPLMTQLMKQQQQQQQQQLSAPVPDSGARTPAFGAVSASDVPRVDDEVLSALLSSECESVDGETMSS